MMFLIQPIRWVFIALVVVRFACPILTAQAYEPTKSLLESKGFSPLTADIVDVQAKRQEWKQPPPPERTPVEQVKRNIWINDWLGNVDPFGSYIIRERQ